MEDTEDDMDFSDTISYSTDSTYYNFGDTCYAPLISRNVRYAIDKNYILFTYMIKNLVFIV